MEEQLSPVVWGALPLKRIRKWGWRDIVALRGHGRFKPLHIRRRRHHVSPGAHATSICLSGRDSGSDKFPRQIQSQYIDLWGFETRWDLDGPGAPRCRHICLQLGRLPIGEDKMILVRSRRLPGNAHAALHLPRFNGPLRSTNCSTHST